MAKPIVVSIITDAAEFSKGMGDVASKAGKTFATIGKVAAVGLVAGGVAVAKLTKDVIDAYGEWQQAAGGVEAVYGKLAPTVMKASAEAYKMGMSSTDFLANQAKLGSLLQANGLTSAQAWEQSNAAMVRANDMASVMGISTQEATQAIVGMAKGNYSMMDNLGVKMDATTLKAYAAQKGLDFTTAADKNAVAMQYFMEQTNQYAGNAAQEAQKTIQGSLGMLKASWSDLLAGMGDSESDMTALITNVADSLKAVLSNITPVVQNVISTLPMLLSTLLPVVLALVPDLIGAGIELITSLVSGIVQALPKLVAQVVPMLLMFVSSILGQLPMILNAGIEVLVAIADGIVKAIPKLVPVAIDTILKLVDTLLNNLPKIIETGITLIVTLALALIDALPKLAQKVPQIITKIVTTLIANIDKIIDAGVKLLLALVENLPEIIEGIVKAIPKIITGIVSALKDNWPKIQRAGEDLLKGLWKGISDTAGWLKNKILGLGGDIIKWVKGIFDQRSPSRVFAQIGRMNIEGLANGLGETRPIEGALNHISGLMDSSFEKSLAFETMRAGGTVLVWNGDLYQPQNKREADALEALADIQRKMRTGV